MTASDVSAAFRRNACSSEQGMGMDLSINPSIVVAQATTGQTLSALKDKQSVTCDVILMQVRRIATEPGCVQASTLAVGRRAGLEALVPA